MKPLRLSDRIVLGFVSGCIGAILGGLAAVFVAFGLRADAIAWSIVPVSGLYFFAIGAIRGPDAGFFVGDALSVIGAASVSAAGAIPGESPHAERPSAWGSTWLLVAWLVMIAILGCRAHA